MKDLVSIVIPTYERKSKDIELLKRAVNSVQNQTFKNIEIIIVIDGKAPLVEEYFSKYSNVNVIKTIDKVGGSKARNIGIECSKGKWIALLDDDDEWMPEKISKQLEVLQKSTSNNVVCFTSLKEDIDSVKILPNFTWKKSMDISEYIFGRKKAKRIGFIQTSTLFTSKDLLIKCPFKNGLIKHQDWDWLLRANKVSGVTFVQIEEPLVYYHADVPLNQRVGYINRWKFTEKWGKSMQSYMSDLGYSFFVTNIVLIDLVRDKSINKRKRLFLAIKKFKEIPYKEKWQLDCLITLGISLIICIQN